MTFTYVVTVELLGAEEADAEMEMHVQAEVARRLVRGAGNQLRNPRCPVRVQIRPVTHAPSPHESADAPQAP